MVKPIKIAIVIPVFNRRDVTVSCLTRLQNIIEDTDATTVIVVDDASTDGTPESIAKDFPWVDLVRGAGDLWWTAGINRGIGRALSIGCEYVLLLNDDLQFDTCFFELLVEASQRHPDALVSSLKLKKISDTEEDIVTSAMFRKGFFQIIEDEYSGLKVSSVELDRDIKCEVLTGASLLIPAQVIRAIGLLDEKCFPHNWGDFEYTLRATNAGYECYLAPLSRVYIDGVNPNYHKHYLLESSRTDYVKNLFDNHRYNYGYERVWRLSFLYRPFYLGALLFVRRAVGLTRWVILKLLLPNRVLRMVVGNNK